MCKTFCLCVCMCTTCVPSTQGSQKRVLGLLQPVLQIVVNCSMGSGTQTRVLCKSRPSEYIYVRCHKFPDLTPAAANRLE